MDKTLVHILCAEDEVPMQEKYRASLTNLARFIGIEVDFRAFVSLEEFQEVVEQQKFVHMYITDGYFYKNKGDKKAKKEQKEYWKGVVELVRQKEGSLDKLILISANSRIVREAFEMGIKSFEKKGQYMQGIKKLLMSYSPISCYANKK